MTNHIDRSQDDSMRVWSRRAAIPTVGALIYAGLAAPKVIARQADATPAATPAALNYPPATMPDWEFTLITFADPYGGTVTKPASLPGGIRVIAFEVVLENRSQQPLEFVTSDVRLRDLDGVEYRAGEYLGAEPRLVSQNLPDGERTRGWVWFGVSEATEVQSLVFVAPPPVLQISLS